MATIDTLIQLGKQLEALKTKSNPEYAARVLEWVRAGSIDDIRNTVDAFLATEAGVQAQETAPAGALLPVDTLIPLEKWLPEKAAEMKTASASIVDSYDGDVTPSFMLVRDVTALVKLARAYLDEQVSYGTDEEDLKGEGHLFNRSAAYDAGIVTGSGSTIGLGIELVVNSGSHTVNRSIEFRGTVDEVKALQTLLAADPLLAAHLGLT
ncbi:Hypothetical protein POVN_LOCUS331 [uncultured virus]|nr:Hypothetical protein POVN_LOCUS331 [uncultured virus]